MTLNNHSKISGLHREAHTTERQADARALADWNLNVLLERVEKATESSRELDARLWFMLVAKQPYDEKGGRSGIPSYTASVDAALALVERLSPEALVRLSNEYMGYWVATVGLQQSKQMKTAPLAILAALLKALIARNAAQAEPTELAP